ncbi:MAG: serine/threonine-protein kinase HipA [Bacteriovoracaceae bacterium]|jgi:serine/threonine-protein kinase HipA
MSKLNVFYKESLVGTLSRDSDLITSFSYSAQWLKDKDAFKLSLAMPLQKEIFGNKITLSFFENLIPEGDARDSLEKSQQTKGTYDILKKFGEDCAGAIILSEKEESPFDPSNLSPEIRIEIKDLYKAIDEKRSIAEVIANLDPGYLSIAGAQDKFVAIYRDKNFYLPSGGLPTTHIVKAPIYRSGVKESVYNEYYCMKLAELVGLSVPSCFILKHKEHPLYVTQRYDREIGTEVKRIHQQDFCQAQGIVSEFKYEAKGGPTLKDNYLLIKNNVTITKRSKALFDYLNWICFNLLIGNNDSHSKNISLLLVDGRIEMAPFYDLLSTAVYPKLKKDFSFKLGDRDDPNKIGASQFQMVDQELDLKLGTMEKKALEMSQKLLRHKDALASKLKMEYPNAKVFGRISELIEKRCKNLFRQGL